MHIGNFRGVYQGKTDEELLQLAKNVNQLSSEARGYHTSELAKRGVSKEQLHGLRQEEELGMVGSLEVSEPVTSAPIGPASESYTFGSFLSLDKHMAPWRPKAAGRIAFFFGPIAGALVVALSLRRMDRHKKAKMVILLALAAAAGEAIILFFIPDALTRFVGFGAEIAFVLIFPVFMENEFEQWQAAHPSALPANGWKTIGWGLVGTVLFLMIILLVFLGLSALLSAS